jgi:putative ATP-dependent endonuclease of OLD family
MLRAFPDAYQQAEDGGRGPNGLGTNSRIESAAEAVLKPEGTRGHTYSADERESFIWYQYLFLGRSKPLTHLLALNRLDSQAIATYLPPMLKRLIEAVAGQQTTAL